MGTPAMNWKPACGVVLALFVTACGETRSVEYFREHPEEAREVKMRCGANSMAGKDCGNAVTALNELQREAFERSREANRRNRENNVRPVLKN